MKAELADVLPPQGRNAILEAVGQKAPGWLEDRLIENELDVQQPVSAQEEGVDGLYFPISCLMWAGWSAFRREPASRCPSSVVRG